MNGRAFPRFAAQRTAAGLAGTVLLVTLGTGRCLGAQYVVPGGSGSQTGASWAHAHASVQAAVDAAVLPGEEVWVAAGRYALDATLTLRTDSVVLGGFHGTETSASQRDWKTQVTVLDG